MIKNEILLVPEKFDLERDSVASAWKQMGGVVKRIAKFWEKPEFDDKDQVTIYGNDTFSLVLAQVIDVSLISPKDEVIAELSEEWTKRNIQLTTLRETEQLNFPMFVKPVKPKLFSSKVYDSFIELQDETSGINGGETVITSETVTIEAEVRSFILNNNIQDLAFYEGTGNLQEAHSFIESFLENCSIELPSTYVMDIGFNSIHGWFIIEFNATWGSGLNNCNPKKVIPCIQSATKYT